MTQLAERLLAMAEEERELQFDRFDNETALELGLAIIGEAKRQEKGITVEIYRGGQRLFAHAMAGTSAENENWIRRKNNVVNHFGQSSWRVALTVREEGKSLETDYGLPLADYVGAGGGFPLIVRGEGQVGTITVSGLPDQEDHDLLIAALRGFLSRDSDPSRGVAGA
ncbi:heme-degrading domain-containing protein [Paenibacillus xanthanilyticus]|uniref:UPF0303 protein ACFOZ8_17240 n=1 Tax=Paenibacillus xanthanilyticus TaxID=1783531 RepID=A0ABV8K5X7_9BACL